MRIPHSHRQVKRPLIRVGRRGRKAWVSMLIDGQEYHLPTEESYTLSNHLTDISEQVDRINGTR